MSLQEAEVQDAKWYTIEEFEYMITLANYSDEERFHIWNTDAYHELANFLKNKKEN